MNEINASFLSRWTDHLESPAAAWKHEKQEYEGTHPGFINTLAYSVLALLTLLSIHHLLQSIFYKKRYFVTDIYLIAWFVFALWTGLCELGVTDVCWESIPILATAVVVYRLIEILPRELWVTLYRPISLTTVPRVIALALLNYATILGLFGFLYGDGTAGYVKAATVSLTVSLSGNYSGGMLEPVQVAYCFVFSAIVLAIFIGRVKLS